MNIIDMIDNYLLNREHESSNNHHPSGATKCLRAQFYKRTGCKPTNPPDAGALWKMEMGNAIHSLIAQFIKDSGAFCKEEVAFQKHVEGLEFPISGRIDNVMLENGSPVGIEVKTSFGRGVVEIQRRRQPKEDALIQVALYLWCTDMTKFYIVYVGRDNAYRTQFVVEKDKENRIIVDGIATDLDFKTVCEKFFKIEQLVKDSDLPDREYKVAIKNGEIKDFTKKGVKYKADWQCNYCNYKDLCWKGEAEKYEKGDNSEDFS